MLFGKTQRKISRILIVEDEPLVAFDNEHFLNDAGYRVIATVDGVADAIRLIEAKPLDLVLTDVNLSDGGSGVEVASKARDKGVPLLFVTGSCPVEAQAMAIGCLTKPYNQRDLLTAIEAVDAILAGRKPKRVPRAMTLFNH